MRALLFEQLEPGCESIDGLEVRFRRPVLGESLDTILEAHIRSGEPMRPELALYIAAGIASRLHAFEAHGDLVPHHVIVGFDGSVHLIDPVLTDWPERASQPSRLGYRSPEHVRRDALSVRSDVFVLGALIFELTTARRLFAGDSRPAIDAAIAEARAPRPRALVASYSVELQALLRQMLRPEPEARFASGAAARDTLAAAGARFGMPSAAQVGSYIREHFATFTGEWRAAIDAVEAAPAGASRAPPPLRPSRPPAAKAPVAKTPAMPPPLTRPTPSNPPPLRVSAPARRADAPPSPPPPAKKAPVLTLEDLDRADEGDGPGFVFGEAAPSDGLDLDSAFVSRSEERARAATEIEGKKPLFEDEEHTIEEAPARTSSPSTDLVADLLGNTPASSSDEIEIETDESTTEERLAFSKALMGLEASADEGSTADNLAIDGLFQPPADTQDDGEPTPERDSEPAPLAARKIRARTSSVLKALSKEVTPSEMPPQPPPPWLRPEPDRAVTPTKDVAPDPEKAFLEAKRILEAKRKERERADTPTSPASPAQTPPALPPDPPEPPPPTPPPPAPLRSAGRRSDTLVVRKRAESAHEDAQSSARTVEILPEGDVTEESLVVPVSDGEVEIGRRRILRVVFAVIAVLLLLAGGFALRRLLGSKSRGERVERPTPETSTSSKSVVSKQ